MASWIEPDHPWVSLEIYDRLEEFSWKSVSCGQTEVWTNILKMSGPAIINKRTAMEENGTERSANVKAVSNSSQPESFVMKKKSEAESFLEI